MGQTQNEEFDNKSSSKKIDYSSKLASQIRNEVKLNHTFINKYLSREIKSHVRHFLKKEKIRNIKEFIDGEMPMLVRRSGYELREFRNEGRLTHSDGDLNWEKVFDEWLSKVVNVQA